LKARKNAGGDGFRSPPQRIIIQMSITGFGRCLGMTNQTSKLVPQLGRRPQLGSAERRRAAGSQSSCEPRRALRISSTHPSRATRCGPFVGCIASRTPSRPSCSRLSVARPSRRLALPGWWNAPAKLGFKAHPHMLRHACGFALANKGHDTRALQAYLGHKNIQHTVRYTGDRPCLHAVQRGGDLAVRPTETR
jgi:hypothetical protein